MSKQFKINDKFIEKGYINGKSNFENLNKISFNTETHNELHSHRMPTGRKCGPTVGRHVHNEYIPAPGLWGCEHHSDQLYG